MEKDINITVDKGIKELVIRKGEAEKIEVPKDVKLEGVIESPVEFYKKRKSDIVSNKCHVKYSLEELWCELIVNENFGPKFSIKGKIEMSEEVTQWGIQTKAGNPSTKTLKELSQLLAFNKRYFADPQECTEMLNSLQKFRASVTKQWADEDDKRGNTVKNYEVKVETGIKMNFVLLCPVFKGQDKKKFLVEVKFDAREKELSFWLESTELADIIDTDGHQLVKKQVEEMSELVNIRS